MFGEQNDKKHAFHSSDAELFLFQWISDRNMSSAIVNTGQIKTITSHFTFHDFRRHHQGKTLRQT